MKTKLLLDSGDPQEYKEASELLKSHGQELWGSTTNPSLIAKKLSDVPAGSQGKKLTPKDAFALQKALVLEIVEIVPGAVSAEVYSDLVTSSEEMIEQGRDIATWHERVVVKLPTTLEGFKARTILRREGIAINNTLVFSQEQIFAICLHEKIVLQQFNPKPILFPTFISPFVGRLDDKGENGMVLVAHGMQIKNNYFAPNQTWMLEASIRSISHVNKGLELGTELMTLPIKIVREMVENPQHVNDEQLPKLIDIPLWQPGPELLNIKSVDEFMEIIENGKLNIQHDLTTAGIEKFVADWKAILT